MPPCSKIPYATQQRAKIALRAIRRKGAVFNKKQPAGVHWCGGCRAWHLTSQPGNRRPPWQKKGVVKA